MSSISPQTLAIGGAVAVVGGYFLLSGVGGNKGHVGDRVDTTAGTAYPDNPYTDNPVVPEKERDDGIPVVGGVIGSLEDAKLKYWVNQFQQKGYGEKVKNGVLLTRALLKSPASAKQAVDMYFATVRIYNDEKKELDSDWEPSHWSIADPLLIKNGNELDALRPQIEAVQSADDDQQIVNQLTGGRWSADQREAYLATLPIARQTRLRALMAGTSKPLVPITPEQKKAVLDGIAAAASTVKTIGAGLEHLLADNAYAIMADQWVKMSLDQQKAYTAQLTQEQRDKLRQAILARKAREGR